MHKAIKWVLHLPNISNLLQIQRILGFSRFGCKANKNKFPIGVVLDDTWCAWCELGSLSTVTYKWLEVVYSFSCTLSSDLKTRPHPIPTKRINVLINLISIYSCGSTDLPHDSFWFSLSSALGSVQKFNFGSHLARSWLEIIYYRYILLQNDIQINIYLSSAIFEKQRFIWCRILLCLSVFFGIRVANGGILFLVIFVSTFYGNNHM